MRRALIAIAVTLAVAVPAWSRFTRIPGLPVDRLVAKLTRLTAEQPDDAHLAYLLGRVHAYAFAFRKRLIPGTGRGDEAPFLYELVDAEDFQQTTQDERARLAASVEAGESLAESEQQRLALLNDPAQSGPCSEEELLQHLSEGVRWHLRAVSLGDGEARHHLGLAWLLEGGAKTAPSLAEDPLSATSDTQPAATGDARTRAWLARSDAEYLRAFDLSYQADGALETQPMSRLPGVEAALRRLVSFEAGLALLRFVDSRAPNVSDAALEKRVSDHLAQLGTLPRSEWISPILLSLDANRPLDALLSPDREVCFDLDGLGARRWPWLQPDTALLVWDPDHTGHITSGVQLFGSVTWWLFFDDGYQALELLDDDGDGWLAGAELQGLALWQDRDGDGMSDPGEVTPIEATSLAALAVTATGVDGRSPSNAQGLRLRDGRLLPTYDWVTAPAAEP